MIEQEVKQVVLESLRITESEYSTELAAGDILAWDSLAHVTLLMAVERHFHIVLDVADAIDIETVGDLIETVKRYTQDRT
jgi:acyl carrier protein